MIDVIKYFCFFLVITYLRLILVGQHESTYVAMCNNKKETKKVEV